MDSSGKRIDRTTDNDNILESMLLELEPVGTDPLYRPSNAIPSMKLGQVKLSTGYIMINQIVRYILYWPSYVRFFFEADGALIIARGEEGKGVRVAKGRVNSKPISDLLNHKGFKPDISYKGETVPYGVRFRPDSIYVGPLGERTNGGVQDD